MEHIPFHTIFPNQTTNLNDNSLPENLSFILHVVTCIIISIGIPLLLMAIYALYFLVKNGQVTPIYIINLYISDLIQLCCLIAWESKQEKDDTVGVIYIFGLIFSVCFMMCVSLERCLVMAPSMCCCCSCCFRRTIRMSVAACAAVWIVPPILILILFYKALELLFLICLVIFFFAPFLYFIAFLVVTLKALSTPVSVPIEEKRRIVAIVVLVLLIYTLLFLPSIIFPIAAPGDDTLRFLSTMFLRLGPLADLLLYVFIKQKFSGKFWTFVCCCVKNVEIRTVEVTYTYTSVVVS